MLQDHDVNRWVQTWARFRAQTVTEVHRNVSRESFRVKENVAARVEGSTSWEALGRMWEEILA